MKLPFFASPRDFVIEVLEIDDAAGLPRIHEEDFVRPWSEDEFSDLLVQVRQRCHSLLLNQA